LLRLNRTRVRALIALTGIVLLVGALAAVVHFDRGCDLRTCKWPADLAAVAKAQLKVEEKLVEGATLIHQEGFVQSQYLSSSYLLSSGTIIIASEEDHLIVIFEPERTASKTKWHCYGRPDALIKGTVTAEHNDCGERYREAFR
jgi:hypothetical protein